MDSSTSVIRKIDAHSIALARSIRHGNGIDAPARRERSVNEVLDLVPSLRWISCLIDGKQSDGSIDGMSSDEGKGIVVQEDDVQWSRMGQHGVGRRQDVVGVSAPRVIVDGVEGGPLSAFLARGSSKG